MSWQKPSKVPCKECGGLMVEKGKKLVCANPECGYVTDNRTKNKIQTAQKAVCRYERSSLQAVFGFIICFCLG